MTRGGRLLEAEAARVAPCSARSRRPMLRSGPPDLAVSTLSAQLSPHARGFGRRASTQLPLVELSSSRSARLNLPVTSAFPHRSPWTNSSL